MNMKTLGLGLLAVALISTPASANRSQTAKNQFARLHPCPATGLKTPHCPGYVIDHINPLFCGGADAPQNMQWQTIAEGKAKDKIELKCSR